jgi:hypothetical protein
VTAAKPPSLPPSNLLQQNPVCMVSPAQNIRDIGYMRLFISSKQAPSSGISSVLKQNNLSGFLTSDAAYIEFMTDIFYK